MIFPGRSSVTFFEVDTDGAILPHGGKFQAVGGVLVFGGFVVFGVKDFGGSGKTKYGGISSELIHCGGNFLPVGGFSFIGGNEFRGSGKPTYDSIFSAVMQYGGYCLAVMQYSDIFWRYAVFHLSAVK